MFQLLKSKRAKAAVAAAALALGTLAGVAGSPAPAGADPQQLNAFIGMGSDTIQGITNGYAGFANGRNYTPLQSTAATGFRQLISFDAVDPTGAGSFCIIPKPGAPAVYRPNGSGQGRKALSEAFGGNGTGYGPNINGGANPCGVKDYGGLINFARSSAGPAAGDTGTDLTYIPMGRDGVSFAYYRPAGSPVTQLSLAQLQSIFTTGPQTIGGVQIVGCSIQEGSGTRSFWDGLVVSSGGDTSETAATATCRNATTSFDKPGTSPGRIEENDPVALKAKGDALDASTPGVEVVIGFSAANFIAENNGSVAIPDNATSFPTGVAIGAVDTNNSGTFVSPVTGSAPNFSPNNTFYGSSFGRNVWYVLPTSIVANPGNAALKSLLVGSSAAICSSGAQTTLQLFGFSTASSLPCGDTSTKGSWQTGNT